MDEARDPRLAEELRTTLVPDTDAAFAVAIETRLKVEKTSAFVRWIVAASIVCLCVAAFMTPIVLLATATLGSGTPWTEIAMTGVYGAIGVLSVLLLREALVFLDQR